MSDSNTPDNPQGKSEKQESFDARASSVRRAFGAIYEQKVGDSLSGWAMEVFPDYLIASFGADYFKVPYSEMEGTLAFAPFGMWEKVKEESHWVTMKAIHEKAGARHSAGDLSDFQTVHDVMTAHGAKCAEYRVGLMAVTKDASGKWRWVVRSSSAFEDKENQIVKLTALEVDAARMTATKNYGPLRWAHIGEPDEKTLAPGAGIDIGDCDYSVVAGKIAVDSGTFRDEFYGERLAATQDEIEVSRGFFHPASEPDSEGVYHHIHTFERSLLPKGKASNRLTKFYSLKGEKDMGNFIADQLKGLAELFGNDDTAKSKVKALADDLEKSQADAELKLKSKSEDAPAPPTPPEPSPPDVPEVGETLKALAARVEKLETTLTARTEKNIGEVATLTTQLAAALKSVSDLQAAQTKQATALAELAGDLPAGVKNGYRPSADVSTVVAKKAASESGIFALVDAMDINHPGAKQ